MARTALLCFLPAALIASGWRALEAPAEGGEIALVALLGVLVALLPRLWLRALGALGGLLAVAGLAFGLSPLDARPFDGDRDFFAPLVSGLWNGFLDYYEVSLPFAAGERSRMHGVVLFAVFAFTLGASLAIARRRPVQAAAITFAGAAWPVTLIRDAPTTGRGALLLVAALILLAALRPGARRGARQTALVGTGVLVAALVAVSSPAVAKGGFLNWERWEPYSRPQPAVSVSYVWDANYRGISFPEKPTTVLTIKAPRQSPYWRATTLDSFLDDHWRESAEFIDPVQLGNREMLFDDPLLPAAALDSSKWLAQEVTVRALRDTHLVGATSPIAFERGGAVAYSPGVAHVGRLRRGQDYPVWSYAPQPTPRRLARSRANYPAEIASEGQFLGTGFGPAPPFGTPGRDAIMRELFADDDARVYERLYDRALEVAGRPRNPYAAVVALEVWFRSGGDFRYEERPPLPPNVPPLVAFVEGHRSGYCQHFAGAMALMLRYLGIPARVGAGFINGRYNEDTGEWTVVDTNAHTWVEVWFDGYGWLPFDPTPGRGRLRGSYTASSLFFDVSGATSAFGGVAAAALGLEALSRLGDQARTADRVRGVDPGGRDQGAPGTGQDGGDGLGDSLVGLLLLLAALVTLGLWTLKGGRRRARYLTRDPRRLAGAVRRDLVDFLVDQRVRIAPSATPSDLALGLERDLGIRGDRLAQALGVARYGPAGEAEAAAQRARNELRTVRRKLRNNLGLTARLRGLLSLRSLGLGAS